MIERTSDGKYTLGVRCLCLGSVYRMTRDSNKLIRTALTELSEINSADFVERTARRDYGYCWYGETIYEVGNLEAIAPEPEFEIFGESKLEEKWEEK